MTDQIPVNIQIKTDQEFLQSYKLTLDEVKAVIKDLMNWMGDIFLEFFSEEFDSNDIRKALSFHSVFSRVHSLNGYRKLLVQMRGEHKYRHFFTAVTAKALLVNGVKPEQIELEPEMTDKSGPHPDIRVVTEDETYYVECKTIYIQNILDNSSREQIARFIHGNYSGYRRLDLRLKKDLDIDRLEAIFSEHDIQNQINSKDFEDGQLILETDELEIRINSREPNLSLEADIDVEFVLRIIDVKNSLGTRTPGAVYMRGKHMVCVFDAPPNYSNKLQSKQEQTEGKFIQGHPYYVALDKNSILGVYEENERYIWTHWLTDENPEVSGILAVDTSDLTGLPYIENEIDLYKNPHAEHESSQVNGLQRLRVVQHSK